MEGSQKTKEHLLNELAAMRRRVVELEAEIAERKRVEAVEALRQSERKYRTLIETMNEGVMYVDNDDIIQFVNGRFCDLVGYNHDELLGQDAINLLLLDEAGQRFMKEDIRSERIKGLSSQYEIQLRKKSGDLIWVHISGTPLFDAEGNVIGSVGIHTDVTEQKEAERALQESEHFTKMIAASVGEGIIVYDAELRYQVWNAFMEKLTGLPAEKVLGKYAVDVFPHLQEEGVVQLWERALAGETVRSPDTPYRILETDKTGWVVGLHSPLLTIDGDIVGVVATIREISERKKMDSALRESEERFRVLVDASFEGTAVSVDGLIVEANQAFAEMLGYELGEVVGTTPVDLFTSESAELIMRQIRVGVETSYEVTAVKKDGTKITVEIIGKNCVYQGQNARVTGFRDVTERKRAEESLRQAQKMESLGILAGGVAHDFNNLLVAMMGQASLALAKLSLANPARIHVEKVVTAAERAADLTRQMLAYSGRGHFEIRPIHLNRLIEENLHLFETAVSRYIRLESELTDPLPLIEGDVGQLQQIIMNLILNAADAIGEQDGLVKVKTGVEDIIEADEFYWQYNQAPLQPDRYVTLQVHDTGNGMDEDTMSKIFDPFFTTKFTGRGLGLAAVLGIVRGHNGGLYVHSQLGEGTTFKLFFPSSSEHFPASGIAQVTGKVYMKSKLILVIDDEKPVRDAIGDILELEDLQVIAAADGKEGIDLYQKHAADVQLVLLDLSMPGISGEETFRRLRQIDPDVRVVLSSGYSAEEATSHFADKGLVGFIQKPYSMSTFLEKIRGYLDRP